MIEILNFDLYFFFPVFNNIVNRRLLANEVLVLFLDSVLHLKHNFSTELGSNFICLDNEGFDVSLNRQEDIFLFLLLLFFLFFSLRNTFLFFHVLFECSLFPFLLVLRKLQLLLFFLQQVCLSLDFNVLLNFCFLALVLLALKLLHVSLLLFLQKCLLLFQFLSLVPQSLLLQILLLLELSFLLLHLFLAFLLLLDEFLLLFFLDFV